MHPAAAELPFEFASACLRVLGVSEEDAHRHAQDAFSFLERRTDFDATRMARATTM